MDKFREYFDDVTLLTYPRFAKDVLASRKAIIAKKKRPEKNTAHLEFRFQLLS